MKSRLLGAIYACTLAFNANAAIVDNGTYTTDTSTGLDWLDLTATAGMSYNQVSAELGAGGMFEGWTYATRAQVTGLWDSFGGDSNYYSGWSIQNNGLFDAMAPLVGDLYCIANGCSAGEGYSEWITGDYRTWEEAYSLFSSDQAIHGISVTEDYFITTSLQRYDEGEVHAGSALVRVSAVPVPAAVWLFGSGLLGLIGLARRKVRA
jgi:hypothetical protein